MKILSIALLILGCFLIVYAVFSRFYGEPSVALMHFRSANLLTLANSTLLLSLIAMHLHKYIK